MDMKNAEKKTILIVDDEQINRVLLKKVFSQDYFIIEAADGLDALKLLDSTQDVSAVILDIQMPNLDGYGFLSAVARNQRLRNIPVVVVTGASDEQTQLKALSAGAMDVITKPFNPQLIQKRVNNLIVRIEDAKALANAQQMAHDLHQADTDEVSGLYNKKAFIRQASRILQENLQKKYVLMRWDIDNFKVYNDTFGSLVGDDYLKK